MFRRPYRLQYLFVLVLTPCSLSSGKANAKEDAVQCKHEDFAVKVSLLQSTSSFTNNGPIQITESGHINVSMVATQPKQPAPIKDMPGPLVDLYKTGDDMIDTLYALALVVFVSCVHLVFFACVRERYPNIYKNNVEIGDVEDFDDGFFAWIFASMKMPLGDIAETSGLDVAMFLKTTELCGNILMNIGIPLTMILCPLHFNGSIGMIDPMDQIGIGNLRAGSSVFWLHAFVVWVVVVVVQRQIFTTQREFRDLRLQWLQELPKPRCTTVLVRNIPTHMATDHGLKRFVESLFNEGSVVAAFVMRWVPDNFSEVVKKRDQCLEEMLKAKHAQIKVEAGELHRLSQGCESTSSTVRRRLTTFVTFASEGAKSRYGSERRESVRESVVSFDEHRLSLESVESAAPQRGRRSTCASTRSLYSSAPAEMTPRESELSTKSLAALHQAQEDLKLAQKELDDLQERLQDVKFGFARDGFVTFKRRRDAEFAVNMRITFQLDELLFCEAPDPADVRYEVFLRKGFEPTGMAILGYAFLFVIFVSYTPLLIFVAGVSKVDYMRGIAFFDRLATSYPIFSNLWDSQLSPTLLTVIPSLMPFLLMFIVRHCFSCPSERECQVVLQEWYFRYLIVFLLFLFTVSSSLTQVWIEIVAYPGKVFELLAKSLPNVMHFYMSYVPMQSIVAAANLGRYWVFMTYLYHRQRFQEDYARELSEPEDQDYNGIASRSARVSLIFVIALVFSSICPPICLLAYFTFLVYRFVLGYIMVYAETRKIDTGGVFWACHVRHMQFGLLIYITTMVGIIYDKNKRASYAAGGSYALCAFMWYQLEKLLDCDRLPLEDVVRLDEHATCDVYGAAESEHQTYADASSLALPSFYTHPHLHARKAAILANTVAIKMGNATNTITSPTHLSPTHLLRSPTGAGLLERAESLLPTGSASLADFIHNLHPIPSNPSSRDPIPSSRLGSTVGDSPRSPSRTKEGTKEAPHHVSPRYEDTSDGNQGAGADISLETDVQQRPRRPPVPAIRIPISPSSPSSPSKESKPKKYLTIPDTDQ